MVGGGCRGQVQRVGPDDLGNRATFAAIALAKFHVVAVAMEKRRGAPPRVPAGPLADHAGVIEHKPVLVTDPVKHKINLKARGRALGTWIKPERTPRNTAGRITRPE